MRGTGEPWPSERDRAQFGPGVYAWASRAEAERYLALRKRRFPDLEVIEFQINEAELSKLKFVNVDEQPDPDAWMNQYSRMFGGNPDPTLEYVQRGTDFGVEHYFAASVFRILQF
ncbi:YdhR family protein [Gloeobacter violaceus]|uniref:YdhR family protein n=1 Tax=Gloeobacter violaceus TaxID=33072 RepID=UPI0013E8B809|nr:YdhR family protein [Gloeobacter violaceus]